MTEIQGIYNTVACDCEILVGKNYRHLKECLP